MPTQADDPSGLAINGFENLWRTALHTIKNRIILLNRNIPPRTYHDVYVEHNFRLILERSRTIKAPVPPNVQPVEVAIFGFREALVAQNGHTFRNPDRYETGDIWEIANEEVPADVQLATSRLLSIAAGLTTLGSSVVLGGPYAGTNSNQLVQGLDRRLIWHWAAPGLILYKWRNPDDNDDNGKKDVMPSSQAGNQTNGATEPQWQMAAMAKPSTLKVSITSPTPTTVPSTPVPTQPIPPQLKAAVQEAADTLEAVQSAADQIGNILNRAAAPVLFFISPYEIQKHLQQKNNPFVPPIS